jgi:hypothetical protein
LTGVPDGEEASMTPKKMTILTLQDKKARGEPITMITAYDYPSALAADRAGMDLCSVQASWASSAPASLRRYGFGRSTPKVRTLS